MTAQAGEPGRHAVFQCLETCSGCMFCIGDVSWCVVCGCFEEIWTDHCPGVMLTDDQSQQVYLRQLNYRNGAWRPGEVAEALQWRGKRAS